ncbi:hypothetical protein B0H16DRAFT_1763396 [Mycena metata]|uniref:Uncharacterized protein n=1 Tax=Mycena metata TaxID=1033252 RepID=A0AAD7NT82_9AGAR|nr:hypothetical protein B0H16DRAFT_1763396 [Mycena metata]
MPALTYISPAPPDFTPLTSRPPSQLEFPRFYAEPPRVTADQETQTDPEEVISDLRSELALNFAGNIFDGIIPDTRLGGRQRKTFKWPKGLEIGPEDRLLVVLRAIKKAGFPTLGSFLAQAFRNDIKYNKHPTVYLSISSFLQAQENSAANHPVAIVDLIFRHRKSQDFIDGVPVEPDFTVPRYALPPSVRADIFPQLHSPNTTRNALIN